MSVAQLLLELIVRVAECQVLSADSSVGMTRIRSASEKLVTSICFLEYP